MIIKSVFYISYKTEDYIFVNSLNFILFVANYENILWQANIVTGKQH